VNFSRELPPTGLRRKQIWSSILFLAAVILFAVLIGTTFRNGSEESSDGLLGTVGDFPEDHAWFNTSEPLSLYDQLRGHVTVLYFDDFETLNDLRGLTRLDELYGSFPDEPIQVVVVYTIPAERLPELYEQVEAWEFDYPMIVDDQGEVRLNFSVGGVPALLLIDSTARLSERYGQGWEDIDLEGIVNDLLNQGIARRTLAMDPFRPDGGEYIPERLQYLVSVKSQAGDR
jgi:hypothetical protein